NALIVRSIFLRKLHKRGFVGAVAQPFAVIVHPEPVIKFARWVPVEHVKIDAAPAAFDGDCGEPRHQALADALAARLLRDIEVFEIESGPAEPGRKARMKKRAPRRLAVAESEDRLKFPFGAEAVMQEIGFGRDDRARRALE